MMFSATTMLAQNGSWSDYRDTSWGTDYSTSSTFTISTAEQLAQFAYIVNSSSTNFEYSFDGKTVKLAADIDLSAHYWEPIGIITYKNFNGGTFDGQGHTISGLYVNGTDYYAGLFGIVGPWVEPQHSQTTIKNINISSGTIIGSDGNGHCSGPLMGYLWNGTVQNCHVGSGVSVTGESEYNGGVIGHLSNGIVEACSSAASVSGDNSGGILGAFSEGTMQNCLYYGNSITASMPEHDCAIVGWIYSMEKVILTNNLYCTTANIKAAGHNGTANANDIEGQAEPAYAVNLSNQLKLFTPTTTYTYGDFGVYSHGLYYNGMGYFRTGETVYVTQPNGTINTATVIGKYNDTENLSYTYPASSPYDTYLSFTMPAYNVYINVYNEWDGNGTKNNPYLIKTTDDFDLLAYRVNNSPVDDVIVLNGGNAYYNCYFKLCADLDYSTKPLINGSNYTPIGIYNNNNNPRIFSAEFDGDNHTISGITINRTDDSQGIFGFAIHAIKNLTLANSSITGGGYTGGIVGVYSDGTITNCHVKSDVTISVPDDNGKYFYFGGIVGKKESGNIVGCTCGAEVSGNIYGVGGIVGWNQGGNVKDCLYYGTSVVGTTTDNIRTGAIVGSNQGSVSGCRYTCSMNPIGGGGGTVTNVVFSKVWDEAPYLTTPATKYDNDYWKVYPEAFYYDG